MSYYKYNIAKNDIRFKNSKSTYQFNKNTCEHLDTFVVNSKHYFILEID